MCLAVWYVRIRGGNVLLMKNSVELVSIGTELLSGRSLNTHAQTLGRALSALGWQLMRDTTVPDERVAIQSAVTEAFGRVDIVLVSGGLGATSDDMTRDVLGDLFGCRIVKHPDAVAALHEKYAARGLTVVPAAERQAQILEGSVVLVNPVGMAAAMRLDLPDEQALFILPGPPSEFAGVMEAHVLPWLSRTFGARAPKRETVTITRGMSEPQMVTLLEPLGFPPAEIEVGYYPGHGRVEVLLKAERANEKILEAATTRLRELLAEYVVKD